MRRCQEDGNERKLSQLPQDAWNDARLEAKIVGQVVGGRQGSNHEEESDRQVDRYAAEQRCDLARLLPQPTAAGERRDQQCNAESESVDGIGPEGVPRIDLVEALRCLDLDLRADREQGRTEKEVEAECREEHDA